MARTPIYSDVNVRNPRAQSRVFDFDSVQQSLDNLVRTPSRQRLFYPWGSTFDHLLFSLDVATLYRIQNTVFEALTRDSRVTLPYNQTYVIPQPQDHIFTVGAHFSIKGLLGQTFTKQWSLNGGGPV